METEGPTVGLWDLHMSHHHISLFCLSDCVCVSVCEGHMAKAEDSLQESWIKPRLSGLTAGTTKPYPQHLSFLAFYFRK